MSNATNEAAFLCCPACGGESLAVVVRWNERRPFIAALVCEDCETEIGVEDGEITTPMRGHDA